MRIAGINEELEQEKEKLIREQFEIREIKDREINSLKTQLKNETSERILMKRNIDEMIDKTNMNNDAMEDLIKYKNMAKEF